MHYYELSKTFIRIWILSFFSTLLLVTVSVCYIKFVLPQTIFDTHRLTHIHDAGLVAIGTSLTHYAFPYDEEMEELSKKAGLQFQFVRFSRSSGQPNDFLPLLQPVLAAKPKWVFIEIIPFVSSTDMLQNISDSTHIFLSLFFHYHLHPFLLFRQDDGNLQMKTIAKMTLDPGAPTFSQQPSLSLLYEKFIKQAQAQGTHVIFLQISRSMEAQTLQGKALMLAQHLAIAQFISQYHVEVWVSPIFPLKDYTDGSHLNSQGRLAFMQWFLNRFKYEFMG